MKFPFTLTAIFFCFGLTTANAQNASTGATPAFIKANLHNLKALTFHSGVNKVYFSGIDATGKITVDYMQFDSTGSHDVFTVTLVPDGYSDDDPNAPWLIVPIGNNESETIDDAPFDGELVQKTVRFFNGLLGSKKETFLFVASLNNATPGTKTKAKISVQILKSEEENPPYIFQPILEFQTQKEYVNADDALFGELGIPKD